MTYLRERWLEDHPHLLHASSGSDSGSGSEDEVNPLFLDPTQWKEQDHYAILGLGKLRYRATPEDIKKACECHVTMHRVLFSGRGDEEWYSPPLESGK